MTNLDTLKRRRLAETLTRKQASLGQRTAAAILLGAVGVEAALRYARGPRLRHLRTVAGVRAYLRDRSVTDAVRIQRSGPRGAPEFTVEYVDINRVVCIETYGENGRARLRPTDDPAKKRAALAFVLSRAANVTVAGQEGTDGDG